MTFPPFSPAQALAAIWLAALTLVPLPVRAQGFDPVFATPHDLTTERRETAGSYRMPIGPWRAIGGAVVVAEGAVRQSAYRIAIADGTTQSILADLRGQLTTSGYQVLFECDAASCGGFDFRFDTNVLPEPEMHVDLGDFRYLAARRGGADQPEFVSLLVSRSRDSGFVQVFRVGQPEPGAVASPVPPAQDLDPALPLPPDPVAANPVAPTASTLAQALEQQGQAALDDLAFAPGSADLAPGSYPSLIALSDYLRANPARQVALVGHTDASGSLAANIALSKRRAASVRTHLVGDLGVDRAQVTAEGVGYLAPRASNLTDTGRAQNRRVEVVLTSTQ